MPTLEQVDVSPAERYRSQPKSGIRTDRGMVHDAVSRAMPFRTLLEEIWDGALAREAWTGSALLRFVLVFALVTLCSCLSGMLSRASNGVAAMWLTNGVLFGLIIVQPPRCWLPYLLAGLLGDIAADVVYDDPLWIATVVSLPNALEVICSALLMARIFGVPLDLRRRKVLLGFLAVSVLGVTALCSALGAWLICALQHAGAWFSIARRWYLGDILGMAMLAPLVFMLQRTSIYAVLRLRQLPRTVLLLLLPIGVTALVCRQDAYPLLFLIFPALLLVAFQLRFPGAVLSILLTVLMLIAFTLRGHGPLILPMGRNVLVHSLLVTQVFAAVCIFTMFPVAALLEEQDRLQTFLAASEARHQRLAQTDELTGLPNRRAFNERIAAEWQRAVQKAAPLGLLLVDADHFKQYNDVFGHMQGDECLRVLAGVLASTLGSGPALASRFGGEEFAVLLPADAASHVAAIAERIRAAVEGRRLPHPSGANGVQTVSIGATTFLPREGQGPEAMLKRADEALYCAKQRGRNQVAVF